MKMHPNVQKAIGIALSMKQQTFAHDTVRMMLNHIEALEIEKAEAAERYRQHAANQEAHYRGVIEHQERKIEALTKVQTPLDYVKEQHQAFLAAGDAFSADAVVMVLTTQQKHGWLEQMGLNSKPFPY